jgi:hypothetical protein
VEESPSKKSGDTSELPALGKRPRDASDGEADKPEAKKLCLEESTPLEGDLSDISDDDADEILNREDSVSSASFFELRTLAAYLRTSQSQGIHSTPSSVSSELCVQLSLLTYLS